MTLVGVNVFQGVCTLLKLGSWTRARACFAAIPAQPPAPTW